MKKILIAFTALAMSASANAQPRAIEKIWTFYQYGERDPVGEVVFYCDGGQSATGFISAEYEETYFGCPE